MDRLFVEFHQLDTSRAKRFQGTGLGLALTRRLAEAQGGSVEVRSVVGQGSVFSAVLPRVLHSTHEIVDQALPDVVATAGAATVLVVEDDLDDRKWLSRTLADAGYGVVAAASGADAISAARKRHFDAMTLDLLLPDMSGWEVLEAVRGTSQNALIHTIVITVVKDGANGHGVDDLLVKPVEPGTLLASLLRVGVAQDNGAILVVDDDAPTLRLAARALTELGYRAVCEQCAADALRFIENEQPAAIVVDLIMPEMTGFELIERLRATPHARDLPIIVWTARDLGEEDVRRLCSSGETVIAKTPGDFAPLLREVRRATRAGNNAQKNESPGSRGVR